MEGKLHSIEIRPFGVLIDAIESSRAISFGLVIGARLLSRWGFVITCHKWPMKLLYASGVRVEPQVANAWTLGELFGEYADQRDVAGSPSVCIAIDKTL